MVGLGTHVRSSQHLHSPTCGEGRTRERAEALADGRTVVYRGEVSQADGSDLLKNADLLVITRSFDPTPFVRICGRPSA